MSEIEVYKIEQIEYVTRAYRHHDRITSRRVMYWNANVNGECVVQGQGTRKQARAAAERIVAQRDRQIEVTR